MGADGPYLLVEWGGEGDGKEEREHSVINTKFADLLHPANGYIAGADVSCRLKEGTFHATIITAGTRTECCAAQSYREKALESKSDTSSTKDVVEEMAGANREEELEQEGISDDQEWSKASEVTEKKGKKNATSKRKKKVIMPSNAGPKSKKKVSAKAMETSNAEISEALLQKIMIPPIDHGTTDEAPRQTSTPLKTTDQKDKTLTHPKSEIGVSRNETTTITPDQPKTSLLTDLPDGNFPPNWPKTTLFPNPSETPISPDLPETSFKSGQSDPTLPPDPSTSDLTSTDHTEKKLKRPRSDTPPPRRALGMYYQPWGPQSSSTHSYHGQWMGRDDDDGQSMNSSYSHHYSDPGVAGLRDMVLHMNTQLSAMNMHLQHITSEMGSIKDYIRKPALKKKKSEERERERDNNLPTASRALLGDPQGPSRQKVYLTCVTQPQVLEAERSTSTAEKLATSLLLLLFSTDEIAHGNCTKPIRGNIKQLDSEKLWAIKCHIDYVYPSDMDEKRWTNIQQKTLNPKCRQMRIKLSSHC